MYYAIIDSNNLVIGITIWDGQSPWQPPDECIAVNISSYPDVSIGWSYIDGEFIPPAQEV